MERGYDTAIVVATERQVSCDFDGEAVVLELDNGVYYGLNLVAARVWDMIQDPIRATEIRDALLQAFDVQKSRCEQELMALLDELSARRLIKVTHPSTT
jgi:hypothetical protein